MKLTNIYSIEEESHGFSLVEVTDIGVTKDGKKTGEIKHGAKKRYYGTVYQALQGFVDVCVDESLHVSEVMTNVEWALMAIHELKDKIKEEFCIEVRTER